MTFYSLPDERARPFWRRSIALTTVVGLHLAALLVAFGLAVRPELARPLQALSVRLLEAPPPPPPRIEPPRPKPPVAAPAPVRKAPVAPPPILAAAPAASAAPAFVVAPQAEPRLVEVVPAPQPPLPVSSVRFDADYLQNPKPVYPPMSRRLGEEGKVVLRVRVSAQGTPLSVEIRQSSGHTRLDEAARAAVERWRFVPAKQGGEAVEASVLVPLTFTLDN